MPKNWLLIISSWFLAKKYFKSQTGTIGPILVVILLLAGLGAGVFLINKPTNLKPKAGGPEPTGPKTSFELTTPNTKVTKGEILKVNLVARSDLDEVNLFSAKINYPKDLLEVIDLNEDKITINKWVEKNFDNNSGTISLIGGITSGGFKSSVGQPGLSFAIISFKTRANGIAKISILDDSSIHKRSDAVNILAIKNNLEINIQDKDSDNDGWTDNQERAIGTDPFNACADYPNDNAWPPDFDNNQVVEKSDYNRVQKAIKKQDKNPRYDLSVDGFINAYDLTLVKSYIGKSCKDIQDGRCPESPKCKKNERLEHGDPGDPNQCPIYQCVKK